MNKLTIIIISIFIIWIFVDDALTDGLIMTIIKLFIFTAIGISTFILTKVFKWKFVRFTQIAGFGGLFITLLIGDMLPKGYSFRILGIFVIFIIASIVAKNYLPKKKLKVKTLDERIKNDLKITSTTIRRGFPKGFGRIGGFVIPALPFFSLINENWKKRLDDEAVIHENVHLYYLQNGWVIWMIFALGAILLPLSGISFVKRNIDFVGIILAVLILVHFEYITFNKTNKIGAYLGITTRKFNMNLALTYFIIYAIQIMLIFLIILGVKFIVKLIGTWIGVL